MLDALRRNGREQVTGELSEPTATDVAGEEPHHALAVRDAVATLPPQCREVIVRFYQRDESYRTIAGALGVPIGTVASRISRCLRLLRLALGGEAQGERGTCAAGARRVGPPRYRSPRGDRRLARRILRRAGVSRRALRRRAVVVVSGRDEFGRLVGRLVRRNLVRVGLRVRLRLLSAEEAGARCATPGARAHVCASGWFRDFPDAQTVIEPLFSGRSIAPAGNMNLAQLDVPAINRAIERAKGVTDPRERARAWAAIDRRVVEEAPAVALSWPTTFSLRSRDVVGVMNRLSGGWDLSFTRLR